MLEPLASVRKAYAFAQIAVAVPKAAAIVQHGEQEFVAFAHRTNLNETVARHRHKTMANTVLNQRLQKEHGYQSVCGIRFRIDAQFETFAKTYTLDLHVRLDECDLFRKRDFVFANGGERQP